MNEHKLQKIFSKPLLLYKLLVRSKKGLYYGRSKELHFKISQFHENKVDIFGIFTW